MIDAMYNYRQGEIHSTEFSNAFNALCIPFENSLSEEQIDIFHQILDCVSDTAAAEMIISVLNLLHQSRLQGRCNYDVGDSGLI